MIEHSLYHWRINQTVKWKWSKETPLIILHEGKFSIIQDSKQINMNAGLDGYFTSIVDTSTRYAFRGANTMSNENFWTSSLSLQSSLVVSSNTEGVSPTKQTSYMHKIIPSYPSKLQIDKVRNGWAIHHHFELDFLYNRMNVFISWICKLVWTQ